MGYAHEYAAQRQRYRTDLLFLCYDLLGYKDVNKFTHQRMADHLQKFQGGSEKIETRGSGRIALMPGTYKPFVDMWDLEGPREHLILVPRNHLKTSICTVAHTIQWIINYPDVRILLSSGTGGQVEGFLRSIKENFQTNERFRSYFPEFCPQKNVKEFGNMQQFTVPNRKLIRPEPTVSTTSVGAVVAGAHYDVIKHDDMVDKENVRTPEQIQNVKNHYGFIDPLLQRVSKPPYRGWTDVIGTRYDYCLRGSSQILMADWSEKPISEVRPGDVVVGWDERSRMKRSRVLETASRRGIIQKVSTISGRSVYCTDIHKWWMYKGYKTANGSKFYRPAKMGRHLISAYTPSRALSLEQQRDLDWLGGLLDGEGYIPSSGRIEIVQSRDKNPEVCSELERVLENLGFRYSRYHNSKILGATHYSINGGRSAVYRLLQARTAKKKRIQTALWGGSRLLGDRSSRGMHQIVSIEPQGEEEVFSIQTETGNYIADGYASKNSDLYGTLIDAHAKKVEQGCPEWDILVQSAILEGSLDDPDHCKTIWPKRFPAKELIRIAEDPTRGWPHLYSQYLMDPRPDTSGLVDSEDQIVWVPLEAIKKLYAYLSLHVTVDLAGMEPSTNKLADNDYTVINLHGFGQDGTLFVLNVLRGRYTPFEVIDLLFNVVQLHPRIMDIKVEKEAHTRVLLPFLKREMAKRGKWLPIVEIRRDNRTSKQQRIKGLQPWFRAGRIKFADNQPHKLAIINEIMRFPKYAHDDFLDTTADAMQNAEGTVISDVMPIPGQENVSRTVLDKFQSAKDGDLIYMDPMRLGKFDPMEPKLQEEALTVDDWTGF